MAKKAENKQEVQEQKVDKNIKTSVNEETQEKTQVKVQEPTIEKVQEKVQKKEKKLQIKNIPLQSLVEIQSNCYGELIYINKNSGYETRWDDFGSTQYLSLDELNTMRNMNKTFYANNWIRIAGFADKEYAEIFSVEEILDFLQVKHFYKDTLCPDDIDDVFKMSVQEIETRLPNMSSGIKDAVIVRANELIQNGELDSLKVINAIEKVLGCDLDNVN